MVSRIIIPVSLLSMPGSILMKSSWNKVLRLLSGLSKSLKSFKADEKRPRATLSTCRKILLKLFSHNLTWFHEKTWGLSKFLIPMICLVKKFQSRMKKRQLLRIKSANFPDNFGTLALSQGTIQIGR